jgi:IPT/TIG domain-containing protein
MSRAGLVILIAVTLMGAGCGYGSHNYMNGTGMARITQLSPSNITAGEAAFTLTVTGTSFGTDAVVYWGTSPRTTAYNSATQVTAEITAADIMNAGMVQVYVHSGGANSNTMTFTIQ